MDIRKSHPTLYHSIMTVGVMGVAPAPSGSSLWLPSGMSYGVA